MRRGKYQAKRKPPVFGWVLIGIALISMTIGSVAAYLSIQRSAQNTLLTGEAVQPNIVETMNDNVKSNVSVNVGNPGYAVYVRAAVVVTWKDNNGNVLAQTPDKNTEYTITMGDGWFYDGGFWYCRTMVFSSDGTTDGISPVLIKTCKPLVSKGNYHLSVEIITQTIQALGTTDNGDRPAVTDTWGISVSTAENTKGQLIDPTP